MDRYDVYQHLMNYWNETMQDDCYLISADGWKAEPYRIIVKNKQSGKETDKGWECDLVPKSFIIKRYFNAEKKQLETLETQKENIFLELAELEEEHSTEDGYFLEFDKINKTTIQKRLNEINTLKIKNKKKSISVLTVEANSLNGEKDILENYLSLIDASSDLTKQIKELSIELDNKAYLRYKTLKEEDLKLLVVDDKWMASIEQSIKTEMNRISQRLTQRIKELAERYNTPLPDHNNEIAQLESKVNSHLQKMGFVWNK